jgi:hypothetical protein
MATIQFKRGTEAELAAAAAAGELHVGEPYLETDTGRIAVGTSESTYTYQSNGGGGSPPMEAWASGRTVATFAAGEFKGGTVTQNANNTVIIDPDVGRFAPGGAIYIPGDSSGGLLFTLDEPNVDPKTLLKQPVSLDFWIKLATSRINDGNDRTICYFGIAPSSSVTRLITYFNGNETRLSLGRPGTSVAIGTLSVDEWVHLAIMLSATSTHLYEDGKLKLRTSDNGAQDYSFSTLGFGGNRSETCWIDGLRLSYGPPPFSENFPPPTKYPELGDYHIPLVTSLTGGGSPGTPGTAAGAVRYDIAQSLTAAQIEQAQENMALNTEDFSLIYATAKL